MHVTNLPKTEGIAVARHHKVLIAAIREAMEPLKFIAGYEIIEGIPRSGLYLPLAEEPTRKTYTPSEIARVILMTSQTAVYRPIENPTKDKGWETRRGVLAPAVIIWTAWIS